MNPAPFVSWIFIDSLLEDMGIGVRVIGVKDTPLYDLA